MFTLTLFARRSSVSLVGKLLIAMLCFVLLNQHSFATPVANVDATAFSAPTTFQLVENFESLALGSVQGQNGWQASSSISVVADPENSANRVMWMDGTNIEVYKAFPTAIADTNTGTVHFRLRRDGTIDGYAGSSALSNPTDFRTFATQFGSWIGSGDPTGFSVRDGNIGFKQLGSGFADRTWYCVWLVADNQADTYEVHVKGGAFANTTQLSAAGQTTFLFRNSGADPLRTFFARAGDTTVGDIYIDDIYVDPTTKNLTTPTLSCGLPPTDTTPPTVTWTSPVANGQTYVAACASSVALAVTATDAGGVNRVEFSRLNNSVRVPIANDSSAPYETAVNVCDLNFGSNEITAVAVDTANNRAESKISIDRNAAPTVNAGTDQTITLPAGVTLSGVATDDGLPNGSLTVTWSKLSGPGTVTFADANATATTASFITPGLYTLRLTANDGQVSSIDDVLIAVNSGAAPPTAQFTADKTTGIRPLPVNFADQSTGAITTWVWNFGDGGISVQQNPSYTYLTAGDYTVSLEVTGPGGTNSRIVSAYIRVTNPPALTTPSLLDIENSTQTASYAVGWNPVANATVYELQEQTNGGNWSLIYSGAETSHPLVAKPNGVWCYQVRALNTTTSSGWSAAGCTTVNVPPTPTYTPTATPSSTPTVTPTPPISGELAQVYLPVISNPATPLPTLIPTPTTGWQLIGQSKLNAELLVRQSDNLFVGERKEQTHPGGIYRRSLNNCQAAPDFTRPFVLDSSVLGMAFSNGQGIATAFDKGMFYSTDGGQSWLPSSSAVPNPRAVAISSGSVLVGTERNGLYFSTDGGRTWTNRNGAPQDIITLRIEATTLWIGTAETGVWKLVAAGTAPLQQNDGLEPGPSQNIWDFAFDQSNNIYIATDDGVYRSNTTVIAWQPFGLQNSRLRSLELIGDRVYAGSVNQGVWQRALNSGSWEQVTTSGWNPIPTHIRDLAYEPACQGLFAATSSGVWFYSLPTP